MGGRIPKFLALSYESLSKLEHTFLSSFCSSDSLSVKKGSKSEEGDDIMEQRLEGQALKRKEGAMSQEMQAASRSWTRQGNRSSPEPPEGMQPCRPILDSDCKNSKIIMMCCFKPLSLW